MSNRPRNVSSLVEGFAIAVEAIRTNWLRSLLTILGVAVGVAVVVTVAALITGIRTSIISGVESAGPNNFTVTRFDFTALLRRDGDDRPPWWNKPPLEIEEADAIRRLPAIDEALYNVDLAVTTDFDGTRFNGVSVRGTSSGWPAYSLGDFTAGRDFIPTEVRDARRVVVLSSGLAEELFGLRDPIGRQVGVRAPGRSARQEFTVIGVYEPEENIFSGVIPRWAVIPYTTALKRLRANGFEAQILVVPTDSVPSERAMDRVTELLRAQRGLGPREDNSFALLRSDQIVEVFNDLTLVFFMVMMALSSAGLLVGGVGVIGIMLISVTERTREIGIRKALGATRGEILWQFLVEAGLLTLLGGASGMLIGTVAAMAVERVTPVPASIPFWSVGIALLMAVVTGVMFGLLPAYRASRMEPTVAFRYE